LRPADKLLEFGEIAGADTLEQRQAGIVGGKMPQQGRIRRDLRQSRAPRIARPPQTSAKV
jgi:hypothetical protein